MRTMCSSALLLNLYEPHSNERGTAVEVAAAEARLVAAKEVVEEAAVDMVGLVAAVVEKEKVTVEEAAAVEAVEVADEEGGAGRCSGVSEPNDCCFTIS